MVLYRRFCGPWGLILLQLLSLCGAVVESSFLPLPSARQRSEPRIERGAWRGSVPVNVPVVAVYSKSDNELTKVDAAISTVFSDVGSIVLGMAGLVLLLLASHAGESSDVVVDPASTRANLLAVLAIGSVLLNGLSKLDVTTALAETVQLQGSPTSVQFRPEHSPAFASTMTWALESFQSTTPTQSLVLLRFFNEQWIMEAAAGILPNGRFEMQPIPSDQTPILNRLWQQPYSPDETYLPRLQA
jgi:Cofactor assembly of complex C subunit B, CCB2/CCB4